MNKNNTKQEKRIYNTIKGIGYTLAGTALLTAAVAFGKIGDNFCENNLSPNYRLYNNENCELVDEFDKMTKLKKGSLDYITQLESFEANIKNLNKGNICGEIKVIADKDNKFAGKETFPLE
ncbi:hypothetical protein GW932_03505 [archaeon]|nr:hypothetical protein [archaeon]